MSMVFHVWEVSGSDDVCNTPAKFRKLIKQLIDQPSSKTNAKFLQFGLALTARFPEDDESVWTEGACSEFGETKAAVLAFGMRHDHPDFFAAFFHMLVQASRLGLNVWDGQGGYAYLADGTTLPADEEGDTRFAYDAWMRKDWPLAYCEYRRLAEAGNNLAMTNLGLLYSRGLGHRAHRPLGAALQHLGANSAARRQAAEKATRALSESDELSMPELVARLRAGPLLQVVDALIAEQAESWENVQREMTGPLIPGAGISALISLAATGHEEAQHWVAVACAKGERATRSHQRCTGFTEMAARYGHEPSKRILSEVAGLEGSQRDYAIAERCLQLARARGEPGVDAEISRLRLLQQT